MMLKDVITIIIWRLYFMKKWLKSAGVLLTSAIMLTACSGGGGESSSASSSNEGSAEADSKLIIYSNSLSDGRSDWLKEKASEEGMELEFVDAGGGDIYNRLLAEKNAPQADVTFGMDEGYFKKLDEEGILHNYTADWVADIPEEMLQNKEAYAPLVEQRIFMIANPDHIDEADLPKSWEEPAKDEALKEKYRVPAGVGGGTDQKATMSVLFNYRDENGELGISEEGWNTLQQWFDNGYMPSESEEALQLFADGTTPISYYYSSGIPAAEEEYDFKAQPINSEGGVFSMSEQIGIVNKGDDHNYETAEKFVNWFGSADVQREWAKEFGTWPVNPKAQDGASDRMKELMEQTTAKRVDWDFINENIDAWIEKVELDILP